MAIAHDLQDQPLSAATPAEAERIGAVVLGLAGFRLSAAEAGMDLPAAMPGVPMAHIVGASLALMAAEGAARPALEQALAAAKPLARGTTERERLHLEALAHWAAGDFLAARAAYAALTRRFPRDLLGLLVGQQVDFFTGAEGALRDRIAAALPHWPAGMPGRSHLLSMHAFGLEENGHYAEAEAEARAAIDADPRDAWAHHAVAHVMEMQGRTEEGARFLADGAGDWSADSLLAYHNWWHLALFRLEQQDLAGVLAIYDAEVARAPGAPALECVDAAALLWRLHLRGVDVAARAAPVADAWAACLAAPPGPGFLAFNDLHAAFAYVAAGQPARGAAHLEALEAAARGLAPHARLLREVGLPLVRAVHALGEGEPARALRLLEAAAPFAGALGGSKAQRDAITLTRLAAAEAAGDRRTAEALAGARLAAKPGSPFATEALARARRLPEAA